MKCRTEAVNNLSWPLETCKMLEIEVKTYKNIRISDATSNSVATSAWLRYASNMKHEKCHLYFCNLFKYKTKREKCGRDIAYVPSV